MTDDKLASIAYAFDDYLTESAAEHGIDVLTLTSVYLARLVLCNDYAGCGHTFRKMLVEVAGYAPPPLSREEVH